ncbi:glycosyltransferase family 2 protein [Brevibacillus fluminis]|uniref:Glycosyltransferase family 2 protein n=1 Tax=Brevibacillus fluminis TaxID=511487 RepID=A0A3M8CZ61_9BACL|nr:glycosyltransferase family 2 protein [Brevibacillus fluminis]RNB81116.1 glycosyltransferase family 2 protein [Brevibacillus fluminis]
MNKVSIVIPAYNEEQHIASTLAAIRTWAYDVECIVVDDGSRDKTAMLAALHADRVISLPDNRGKGFALQTGWEQAKGDVVLLLDADLEESAIQAGQLLAPVMGGECDMAIAVLPVPSQKIGLGLAKGLARYGIRTLTGFVPQAPLSGQRAVRKEVLQAMRRLDDGFGIEVGLTIDALRAGFRVQEVPIPFTHRQTGNDWHGYWHRGREFLAVGRALGRKWQETKVVSTWLR